MKKQLLAIALTLTCGSALAQQITESELQEIQSSFVKDAPTKAIQNVLTSNSNIRALSLNNDIQGTIDHFTSYRVDVKGITDQNSSGRCWMFASMNALRPDVMKQLEISSFDFSHNFNYFWDMFEKSNLFLENMITLASKPMDDREVTTMFQSPINDGGVWNLFYNIAKKYGVVPQSVMPETAHSDNTSQMVSFINERLKAGGYKLREMAAAGSTTEAQRAKKTEILKDVYRILALCLGEPPVEFSWRYKTTDGEVKTLESTPLDFYNSIVTEDYNPENYIMVMNDPTREYYKVYDIKNYRNTIEGVNWIYLNLPNSEIKPAALESIKNNEALYTSSDVGKQFNSKAGIMDPDMYDYESLLGIELSMDKKTRILTRQSGSSHAMLLIGCDVDENGNTLKWELENSWGASSGNGGYLTFTDKWFDEYIFRVVIPRQYLSKKALKALDSEPIELPVWDYMN